jgi:hypothetical protein
MAQLAGQLTIKGKNNSAVQQKWQNINDQV